MGFIRAFIKKRNKKKIAQQEQRAQLYAKQVFLSNNDVSYAAEDEMHFVFDVKGKNNKIHIGKLNTKCIGKIFIFVAGDNNVIEIADGFYTSNRLEIIMGQIHQHFGKITGAVLKVGCNLGVESCSITTYNSHARIEIGDNCMFSSDVNIYHTDAHPILDAQTHQIINRVKELKIGDHVWLGAHTTILKNSLISSDSIVGWGSVLSGKHTETGCIFAGNPAKRVRTGITWDCDGSKGYVLNEEA